MLEAFCWLVVGIGLSVIAYGLPIATSFLFLEHVDAASPLMLPPIPPTREEAQRRARYFEDCQ